MYLYNLLIYVITVMIKDNTYTYDVYKIMKVDTKWGRYKKISAKKKPKEIEVN